MSHPTNEEKFPPLLADPIERIKFLLTNSDGRILIGLAGPPGSGKSTLARSIERQVNATIGEGTMRALGMDGFHLTKAELASMPDPAEAIKRRGAPWTFDCAGMASRLSWVRSGFGKTSVTWPDFQHGVGDPVPDAIEINSFTRVVLVEGLYVLGQNDGWSAVSGQFDERWFLDTPLDISLDRLARRHMSTRGVSRTEAESRINLNDRLNAELTIQSRCLGDWRVQ